jgi:hypothetical protein
MRGVFMLTNNQIFTIGSNLFEKNEFLENYKSEDQNKLFVFTIDLNPDTKNKITNERNILIKLALQYALLEPKLEFEHMHLEKDEITLTMIGTLEVDLDSIKETEKFQDIITTFSEIYDDKCDIDPIKGERIIHREIVSTDALNFIITEGKRDIYFIVKNYNKNKDNRLINDLKKVDNTEHFKLVFIESENEHNDCLLEDKLEFSALIEFCRSILKDFDKIVNFDFGTKFNKSISTLKLFEKLYSKFDDVDKKSYINLLKTLSSNNKFKFEKSVRINLLEKILEIIKSNKLENEYKNTIENIEKELITLK